MDIALVNRGARHSAHLEPWREWLVATNKNATEKKDYWTTKSLVYSSAVVWSCKMSPNDIFAQLGSRRSGSGLLRW